MPEPLGAHPPASDLLAGLRAALAGRFVVERQVGTGGMADVFLAQDLKHQRPVALKVLRPEIAASVGVGRFLREIEIAAGLHHPHILSLYDSGEVPEGHSARGEGPRTFLYYVMPYVEGEALRDRLEREGRLSVADTVRLGSEIADGLQYAHQKGIIHRDIKPENVLLVAGHAVIADFGIARALATAADIVSNITQTGMSVGTPAYMSPEQAFGGHVVDQRSDVYALACMVYEMLSGKLPFQGPTALAVLAQKSGERLNLAPLPETTPPAVGPVLRRALSFDPAHRFDSAAEFAAALRTAVEEARPPGSRGGRAPTLAVLPFANLSAEADTEFLSDGLSEELIHALTPFPGVRVVARSSAFALKGKEENVREVGARLGADFALGGSVRRAGPRLRVTAQLTDISEGHLRWSERYDREVGDVFAIQDDIAQAIVAKLAPDFGSGRAAAPTRSPAAYELYLRGRHAWAGRTEAGLQGSIKLFEQALAEDPEFHLARAAAAEALVTAGLYGEGSPEETFGRAENLARQALTGSPGMAEARVALACLEAAYRWRWTGAESAFAEVLAASPGYAAAHHWYAINLLAPLGRFPEARVALQQARFLDPLSPGVGLSAGLLAYFDRNPVAALEAFEEVLAGNERIPVGHYFTGLALVQAGDAPRALERMQRARALAPANPEALSGLGLAFAVAGRPDDARRMLAELAALRKRRYVSPVLDAQVLVGLGSPTEAMERLLEAERLRAADLVWLGVRPTFDPLRELEVFEALLGRIGVA